jgi:ABC-2 type transport system permease protein
MNNLAAGSNIAAMLWIELRKAYRSRMPLWTAIGSLFMPLGIAFLLFVARNPEISKNLGLVSAKANLLAYAGINWAAYLAMFGQLIAAGGFIFFVLIISWVFGREFSDGTLKDMLAVPVPRGAIVLSKFILAAGWCVLLSLLILLAGLGMGALIGLPEASPAVLLQGCAVFMIVAILTAAAIFPFALFASIGRGYLLPIGLAFLTLMLTNIVVIAGWGEYFPWAVAGLYAQGKTPLSPLSIFIVLLTGLAGIAATHLWWKYADQNR